MSFADWDRYPNNRSQPTIDLELFSGQNWGAPILHSALTNPLSGVGEGTYLRRLKLEPDGPAGFGGTCFASIGAGVKGGAFIGPDETRAQEGRAWMRDSSASLGFYRTVGVAIGGRWTHTLTSSASQTWNAKGYFASFGRADAVNVNPGTLAARLMAVRGGDSGSGSTWAKCTTVVNDPATAAPWLPTKWYRFRWRLVPTGLAGDTQEMHRLIDGGNEAIEGDWLPVASMTVTPTLDPTFYAAPGAGTRYGFACTMANGDAGPGQNYQPYIDLVQFTETGV